MNKDKFFANELAELQARWEQTQDLRIIAEVFDLCSFNSVPLPDWTQPVMRQSIATAFGKNGPDGRVGQSGYKALAKRQDVHERRHSVATWALQLRDSGDLAHYKDDYGEPYALTREGAFQFASCMLRGNDARGEP